MQQQEKQEEDWAGGRKALQRPKDRPRSALLWVCPHCRHARVSEHPDDVIQRNVRHGSKAQRLTAICKNPECPGIGNEAGYRRRRNSSRGGRPTVNLNSRRASHVEAQVSSRNRRQVDRLKDIAEAHNMSIRAGEPCTLYDRMNAWTMQVQRVRYIGGERPMPWRRWDELREAV